MRGDGRDLAVLDGDVAHGVDLVLGVDDVSALEQEIVVGLSEGHARHKQQQNDLHS